MVLLEIHCLVIFRLQAIKQMRSVFRICMKMPLNGPQLILSMVKKQLKVVRILNELNAAR